MEIPFVRQIGNASRLAPGFAVKVDDKLQGLASIFWHGSEDTFDVPRASVRQFSPSGRPAIIPSRELKKRIVAVRVAWALETML
jgi:hypothetical protein